METECVYFEFMQVFQGSIWTLIQKTKIPRALSQATASNRPNVFSFTRPLLEGREGEASEPSVTTMPPLPKDKLSYTYLMTFPFHLVFHYSLLPLFLSGFRALRFPSFVEN
jgi:hypothetical protein